MADTRGMQWSRKCQVEAVDAPNPRLHTVTLRTMPSSHRVAGSNRSLRLQVPIFAQFFPVEVGEVYEVMLMPQWQEGKSTGARLPPAEGMPGALAHVDYLAPVHVIHCSTARGFLGSMHGPLLHIWCHDSRFPAGAGIADALPSALQPARGAMWYFGLRQCRSGDIEGLEGEEEDAEATLTCSKAPDDATPSILGAAAVRRQGRRLRH